MKTRIFISALLAVGLASLAIAQTPESKQSASPTSNQYRIRIIEPLEGATLTGNTVSIVIAPPPPMSAGTSVSPEERKDALRPVFQIWVDGKDHGNLPVDQNVFTATDLVPGPHTIVIAAKNNAGELIDRRELTFTTAERVASTSETAGAPATASTQTTTGAPAADTTQMTTQAPPAPPPAPAASSEPSPAEPSASDADTLPQTASSYPSAALAGLALVAVGLALRRRR